MAKRNTNVRRTKEEVLKWNEERIKNNLTIQEINKKYSTDFIYQANKFGVDIVKIKYNRSESRYKMNHFMEKIDTKEKSYILGFLFADGSITKKDFITKLSVKKTDKRILFKIRENISPDVPLHKDKNNLSLVVCSKQLHSNLMRYGITPNKTYDSYLIPNMNKDLYSHFIRGFFDGDGTIFSTDGGKYHKFNICSINIDILKQIKEIFAEYGINSSINTEIREDKKMKLPSGNFVTNCKNMHRIFVRRKDDLKKLYYFLYKDCGDFYMVRKRKKFEEVR